MTNTVIEGCLRYTSLLFLCFIANCSLVWMSVFLWFLLNVVYFLSLAQVLQLSLVPRPSRHLVYDHFCKWSKTWWWKSLGTRLTHFLNTHRRLSCIYRNCNKVKIRPDFIISLYLEYKDKEVDYKLSQSLLPAYEHNIANILRLVLCCFSKDFLWPENSYCLHFVNSLEKIVEFASRQSSKQVCRKGHSWIDRLAISTWFIIHWAVELAVTTWQGGALSSLPTAFLEQCPSLFLPSTSDKYLAQR